MNNILIHIRRIVYMTCGLPSILGLIRKPDITVLCYHSISNDGWRFSTSIEDFIYQIELISKYYDVISVDKLQEYIKGTFKPLRPSILITFDDGYKNILDSTEYLAKKNIKPVVFLIAENKKTHRKEIDNTLEFLSKTDVKTLFNSGWVFGSHTSTHPNMTAKNLDLEYEIKGSKNKLEEELGIKINHIAYPKGRYSENILLKAKKAGYRLGFSMDDERIHMNTHPLCIPRVGIDGTHKPYEALMAAQPLSILSRKYARKYLKITI